MLLRLVAIGLLATLAGASDATASPETSRDKNNLIGPVQTVTTKARGLSQTETYDLAGRLTDAAIYQEHFNISTSYVFTYDQHGKLHEEIAYDDARTLIYRKLFAYAYDSAGRETAVVAATHDGEFHHAEFSIYDKSGNLSEMALLNGIETYRNVFDVLGRLIYSGRFRDGQLLTELQHTYDNSGHLIEIISYSPDGAVTGRSVSEYDDSGHRIRITTETFQPGVASRWVTTYENDRTGNWIKEITRKETSTSPQTEPAPSHTVQERVIEYHQIPDVKTP
jgi:antitoxin component YwqK of YwqJK toxin-antitoxin module